VERAVILAGEEPVTTEHLSFLRTNKVRIGTVEAWNLPSGGLALETLERNLIRQALEMTGNNQSAAARLLGLTRSKLRTRVKQLEAYS
jgi:DNA-binding NtrC family response regulator